MGLSSTTSRLLHPCTHSATRQGKDLWLSLALLVALASQALGETADAWPPFLAPRHAFPVEVVEAVERVWADPTLSRTTQGRSARVPYELYMAFVDTPDVTAAAARHLRLAKYEVEPLSDDRYRATDNDGATGMYQVLVRDRHRRVILSWGEHAGSVLGTISGSALTVISLTPGPAVIEQTIEAYVRIDNALAAVLARILVSIFGSVADRKLAEGSAVTAKVAEWALERSDEFCHWLAGEPISAARRERFRALAPGCR